MGASKLKFLIEREKERDLETATEQELLGAIGDMYCGIMESAIAILGRERVGELIREAREED